MPHTNSKFLINGGKPLHGSVKVSGAKNSASKLLVASLLTDEKCILYNTPNKISDLILTREICKSIGSDIQTEKDTLITETKKITNHHISEEEGNKTRIAILLAGPMLLRTGRAEIPVPGGCKIGTRPVNFHID